MKRMFYVGLSLLVALTFAVVFIEQRTFAADIITSWQTCISSPQSDQTSCAKECTNEPDPLSCESSCESVPELNFQNCTSSVLAHEPEPDICAYARILESRCTAAFQSCGGLTGPGCQQALETCEANSGIGQCE